MALTPEDVQNKRFTTVRFKEGYDEDEVDAFLDEVEAELRRLLTENAGLRSGVPAAAPEVPPPAEAATPAEAAVPAEPAAPEPAAPQPPTVPATEQVRDEPAAPPPPGDGQEAALRTLLLAQRTADEAIAEARQEAETIVAAARARAESLQRQATDEHAGLLASMQQQRVDLERHIAALRDFEQEYRTRLRAYLQAQLNDLSSRVIEPTASPSSSAGGPGYTTVPDSPFTPVPPPPPAGPSLGASTSPQPGMATAGEFTEDIGPEADLPPLAPPGEPETTVEDEGPTRT